ncbi:MAG: hypothetical protein Q9219_004533 [cf. Caloplaca sp. 3 TL-2023]
MLDGYEELPNDLQEKAKSALEHGHVADEDWKGVRFPDYIITKLSVLNTSGPRAESSREERIPFSGSEEAEEGVEEDNGDKTPSKPESKKRRRAKQEVFEDGQDDDIGEPIKKKTKAATRKGSTVKVESPSDGEVVSQPATTLSKAVAKTRKEAKGKKPELKEAVKSQSKSATTRTKTTEKGAATEKVEPAMAAPKKAKAAARKGTFSGDGEGSDGWGVDIQPKKAEGRPRRGKAEAAGVQSLADHHTDQPSEASLKAKATKNAANTKKPIAKKANNQANEETALEPTEQTTKGKKGRKKAIKVGKKDA